MNCDGEKGIMSVGNEGYLMKICIFLKNFVNWLSLKLSYKQIGLTICNVSHYVCFTARKVKYLFPVQAKSFDSVYDGKDVVAQASKLFFVILFSS